MPDIGVLNEQGFVLGNGLGFTPITESEDKQLNEPKENEGK